MTAQPAVNITQVGGVDIPDSGLPMAPGDLPFWTLVSLRTLELILIDAYQLTGAPDTYRQAVLDEMQNNSA